MTEPAVVQPVGRTTGPLAVLWDLDGTLVDTEPYWIEVEHELAREAGGTWTHEDAMHLVGSDLLDSGRYLRQRLGLDLEPAAIVDRLLAGVIARVQRAVPWRPGARELVGELRSAGVPCGLVTMSYASFVRPILAGLPADSFAVVVTGDAVSRGKPDPEAYLAAAARLGVPAGACLAVEDSVTGTRSAEAAGCPVLVVPNHVQVPPGPGRTFATTLDGLTVDDLAARWSELSRRVPDRMS